MKEIRYAGEYNPVFSWLFKELSREFNFIYDNNGPEYYFANETIYYIDEKFRELYHYCNSDYSRSKRLSFGVGLVLSIADAHKDYERGSKCRCD